MLRAYKYRIYPTAVQKQKFEQTIGCCRLVYNLALEVKMTAYKNAGIKLSAFDLCYQLNDLKKEYTWLNDVDSQALQAAVKKVDVSFKNFFKGMGYPKFKKKSGRQSFQCPNGARKVDFDKGLLTIPKIKNISIKLSRTFSGKIKTITISRVPSGKYFASILVDNAKEIPNKKPIIADTAIGIDLGIKHFAILSNDKKIDNPKFLRNSLQRLKCLSKRLSRKKKGSSNRNKARIKIALQHEKIANQRNDFLHKLSSAITKQYDTVCVENLNVAGMIKNRKLAQAISDVGWSEFIRQINYKQNWNGGNILELPRFQASTKPCSICGTLNETLTLADREWSCAKCGTIHDRDVNAAKNIKQYFFTTPVGNREEPVELSVIAGAKKQEYVAGLTAI